MTIVTLAQNYSARTSELFPFGAKLVLRMDSTLRRNPTVHKTFLQALRNLFPFGAQYDRT